MDMYPQEHAIREDKEVDTMLKLTVRPGEFLMIGKDIKVSFCGGSKNQIPIMIEAPKERSIIRSSAVKAHGFENEIAQQPKPYVEESLSEEAKKKITAIVAEDRWQNRRRRNKTAAE